MTSAWEEPFLGRGRPDALFFSIALAARATESWDWERREIGGGAGRTLVGLRKRGKEGKEQKGDQPQSRRATKKGSTHGGSSV